MPRPWSPLTIFFSLLLISTAPRAADPQADPPPLDPVVLAESTDDSPVVVSVEQTSDAHEAAHVSAELAGADPADPAPEGGVSSADVAEREPGVCKDYGQVCRKSRECCAPLHCAFDGYVHYCRY